MIVLVIVTLVIPLARACGNRVILVTMVGIRCGDVVECNAVWTWLRSVLFNLSFGRNIMSSITCALLLYLRVNISDLMIRLTFRIGLQTLFALTWMLLMPNAVLECLRTMNFLRLACDA